LCLVFTHFHWIWFLEIFLFPQRLLRPLLDILVDHNDGNLYCISQDVCNRCWWFLWGVESAKSRDIWNNISFHPETRPPRGSFSDFIECLCVWFEKERSSTWKRGERREVERKKKRSFFCFPKSQVRFSPFSEGEKQNLSFTFPSLFSFSFFRSLWEWTSRVFCKLHIRWGFCLLLLLFFFAKSVGCWLGFEINSFLIFHYIYSSFSFSFSFISFILGWSPDAPFFIE